jgi:hypothetical protein
VTFTLFRPGFFWDSMFPPYEERPGVQLLEFAEHAPHNAQKRVWIEGTNLDGQIITKGALIPLGEPGPARERLARAGLRVLPQGDELQILSVAFGSQAARLGVEPGWRVTKMEVPSQRPAKEWLFMPALFLLFLVVALQRQRMAPSRTGQLNALGAT